MSSGRTAKTGCGEARRVISGATALVIAGAMVAGCGGSGTSSSPSSPSSTSGPTSTLPAPNTTSAAAVAPPGFTTFTDAADRFSISFPESWRKVDPSSPGAAQAIQDLVKSNPGLATVASGDLVAQGIKFLAVASAGATVNVVVKPAVGARDSDLPDVVDQVKAEYAKIGGAVRTDETVQVAGRTGLRLTVDLQVAGPTGAKTQVSEVQYFLLANDLAYILTEAGSDPQFPAVANTFRVS